MFPNMSDDFVMLAFDQEQTIPNNLCAEKLFDHSLPINNNDNGFKEKIQKCSLVPAIIFGATHIPVKKEEEFPEDPDFLANCGYQSAKTPIPENLRLVLQHVSKSAKKEVISQTWPSDDIPYAKQSNHWVSITFLEYSNQIGNVFRGFTTEIFIEGIHANPDPRRMCLSKRLLPSCREIKSTFLGQMINAEKRTASREIVNQIGEGIHLRLLSKAVELSSKCSLPIFLQAPVFSLMYDRNVNVSTVYRLPPCKPFNFCIYLK